MPGPCAGTKPDGCDDAGKTDDVFGKTGNSGKTDGCSGYVWNMAEGHDPDVFGRYIWTCSIQYGFCCRLRLIPVWNEGYG